LFGVGQGLVNTPITNAAVSGMPKEQAGVASALASTSRQVGASLGVAVAGTVGSLAAYSWIVVASGLAVIAVGIAATRAPKHAAAAASPAAASSTTSRA
jgi:hypothetical protein